MEIKKQKEEEEEEFVHGNDIHINPDQHPMSETVRSLRDFPPAHFTLKMKSFTSFLDSGLEKYKSNVFEAGGYNWRLSLYPKGTNKAVKDHISLYLSIVHKDEKSPLSRGWEVFAIFKFFVYDHIRNKYLTIQDSKGEPFRFHQTKSKWGFDQFLPVDTLKDSSNGYLREDSCVFGAEVFVVKYNGSGECLSTEKDPADSTYTWKIEINSALTEGMIYSEEFEVGGYKWKLSTCSRGGGTAMDKSISLYLSIADSKVLPTGKKIYVEYTLRIRDQLNGAKNFEKTGKNWFSGPSSCGWGYNDFLSLKDLNCKTAGYIVDDTILLEVQITLICVSKSY